MTIEVKLSKQIESDSPDRCQAIIMHGQCPFKKAEGFNYCDMHKASAVMHQEHKSCRMYRINRWQQRVNEIADHDRVKSLREEIGVSRMLLEEILNKCDDSSTLLLYSSKIADLVTRIEKLVTSCHRLEASTGMLLDKSAAVNMAMKIVEIIGEFIHDEDVIEKIANKILDNILTGKEEQKLLPTGA